MSKSFELVGQIHAIKETQVFPSGFQKREIVLLLTGPDVNDQYPDHVQFEFKKDDCDKLNGYTVGQEVEIGFNIGGNLWDGNPAKGEQCFNTLGAWKIKALSQPMQGGGSPATGNPATPAASDNFDIEGDDIPFMCNQI